jgi:hypothetical protein
MSVIGNPRPSAKGAVISSVTLSRASAFGIKAMAVLADTLNHLMSNVLAAASEYQAAEDALSQAHQAGSWHEKALTARRKAAELAVAIDGLSDRASLESKNAIDKVRGEVSALCFWPGSNIVRREAFERVHSVANAYKHSKLNKATHVINSFDDVLTVGLGFGLDGFGVGKFSGVEVLVRDKAGTSWKFLGDAPTVICAWFRYLGNAGTVLPNGTHYACGIQVHAD